MKIQYLRITPGDSHKIFLIIALFLGCIVRFLPVALAGYPVNDGGMFYVMIEELKANNFILPDFTHYNLSNIPFTYPPLGFYISAFISTSFRLPTLALIRWLPPFVSTLSLLAFYLMACEILHSKLQAALATQFYSLFPAGFEWLIMGGGITRSFGFLFLFLTITYANRLFIHRNGILLVVLTAIFGSLAFLSHPENGIQAAAICILLWFFRGRSKKTFFLSFLVSLIVIVVTAPWWGRILSNHGAIPLLSAKNASVNGNIAFYLLVLLELQFGGGVFFHLTIALGILGLLAVLAQRKYILSVWLVLPFLVGPRSAHWMVLIPISMLAAYGFDQVLSPSLLSLLKHNGTWLTNRFVIIAMFGMVLYLFFCANIFDLKLAEKSLSEMDREMIAWVDEHIPPGNDFLLLTGEIYSMRDPLQEWFPALVCQHSQTTLQGLEWTLGKDFFLRHNDLVTVQQCNNVNCIDEWTDRTRLEHRYLLIKKLPEESSSPLHGSLKLLLDSVINSNQYENIYENGAAIIFERSP